MKSASTTNIALQSLAVDFFRKSAGNWNSQRRYYNLNKDVEPQEVETLLKISFLEQGASELIELAKSHELEDLESLACGTKVTWSSNYTNQNRKPVTGSTVFGIKGNVLYRNLAFSAIIGMVILASLCFPMTAIATTQDLQINSKAGYTVEAKFSYDDTRNIGVIRESGKGKTKAIDSLLVNFYNPAGEMIASYDNIANGVAKGNYFEFNFDPATQQLLGEIDLGGESAGEIYLKGEIDRELSLIEIDASGEEKTIDVVRPSSDIGELVSKQLD